MKTLSRLSVAACTALALGSLHAQSSYGTGSGTSSTTNGQTGSTTSQYGSGTSSPNDTSTGTTGMSSSNTNSTNTTSGSSYSSMQPLPTEPTAAGGDSGYSWLPYTTSGYIGLSLGNATLEEEGCLPGLACDNFNGALNVVTGGMFTPYIGMQLGYFRLGSADRNGGEVKVSGVNLSLTGVAALGTNFSLVGRVGGTYGWTDTTVGAGVTAASGEKNAFGPAYGVGLSWDFSRNWSATLDWDRHHLKFADNEQRKTDVAAIGFKYRF